MDEVAVVDIRLINAVNQGDYEALKSALRGLQGLNVELPIADILQKITGNRVFRNPRRWYRNRPFQAMLRRCGKIIRYRLFAEAHKQDFKNKGFSEALLKMLDQFPQEEIIEDLRHDNVNKYALLFYFRQQQKIDKKVYQAYPNIALAIKTLTEELKEQSKDSDEIGKEIYYEAGVIEYEPRKILLTKLSGPDREKNTMKAAEHNGGKTPQPRQQQYSHTSFQGVLLIDNLPAPANTQEAVHDFSAGETSRETTVDNEETVLLSAVGTNRKLRKPTRLEKQYAAALANPDQPQDMNGLQSSQIINGIRNNYGKKKAPFKSALQFRLQNPATQPPPDVEFHRLAIPFSVENSIHQEIPLPVGLRDINFHDVLEVLNRFWCFDKAEIYQILVTPIKPTDISLLCYLRELTIDFMQYPRVNSVINDINQKCFSDIMDFMREDHGTGVQKDSRYSHSLKENINAALKKGMDPDTQDSDRWSLAHHIIHEFITNPNNNDLYAPLDCLLHRNGNFNLQNRDGHTPLHFAVMYRPMNVDFSLQLVNKYGAIPEMLDHLNNTAAGPRPDSHSAIVLESNDRRVKDELHELESQLHLAIEHRQVHVFEAFLNDSYRNRQHTENVVKRTGGNRLHMGSVAFIQFLMKENAHRVRVVRWWKNRPLVKMLEINIEYLHRIFLPRLANQDLEQDVVENLSGLLMILNELPEDEIRLVLSGTGQVPQRGHVDKCALFYIRKNGKNLNWDAFSRVAAVARSIHETLKINAFNKSNDAYTAARDTAYRGANFHDPDFWVSIQDILNAEQRQNLAAEGIIQPGDGAGLSISVGISAFVASRSRSRRAGVADIRDAHSSEEEMREEHYGNNNNNAPADSVPVTAASPKAPSSSEIKSRKKAEGEQTNSPVRVMGQPTGLGGAFVLREDGSMRSDMHAMMEGLFTRDRKTVLAEQSQAASRKQAENFSQDSVNQLVKWIEEKNHPAIEGFLDQKPEVAGQLHQLSRNYPIQLAYFKKDLSMVDTLIEKGDLDLADQESTLPTLYAAVCDNDAIGLLQHLCQKRQRHFSAKEKFALCQYVCFRAMNDGIEREIFYKQVDLLIRLGLNVPLLKAVVHMNNIPLLKRLMGSGVKGFAEVWEYAKTLGESHAEIRTIVKARKRAEKQTSPKAKNTPAFSNPQETLQQLFVAIGLDDVDTVISILEEGVGVDVEHDGLYPLHYATQCGSAKVVRELLKRGASTDLLDDRNGLAPLHYVAKGKNMANVLQCFIEANADLNLEDREGRTLVTHLVNLQSEHVLGSLFLLVDTRRVWISADDIERANHPNIRVVLLTSTRRLVDAIMNDRVEDACKLICDDINVNLCDNATGDAPLHAAVRKGNIELIKKLVAAGASFYMPNAHGETALHLAVTLNKVDVLEYILSEERDEISVSLCEVIYQAASENVEYAKQLQLVEKHGFGAVVVALNNAVVEDEFGGDEDEDEVESEEHSSDTLSRPLTLTQERVAVALPVQIADVEEEEEEAGSSAEDINSGESVSTEEEDKNNSSYEVLADELLDNDAHPNAETNFAEAKDALELIPQEAEVVVTWNKARRSVSGGEILQNGSPILTRQAPNSDPIPRKAELINGDAEKIHEEMKVRMQNGL